MAQEPIKVCMLGEFSLQNGSVGVNDGDNRTKKVWLLLAYMIYCRGRTTTPDELVELLWGSEGGSINPLNALKTMFHRVPGRAGGAYPDPPPGGFLCLE